MKQPPSIETSRPGQSQGKDEGSEGTKESKVEEAKKKEKRKKKKQKKLGDIHLDENDLRLLGEDFCRSLLALTNPGLVRRAIGDLMREERDKKRKLL